MLVDTHCHLDRLKNIETVIANAKKAGVERIVCPGVNAVSSKKCVSLAKKYKGVYAAVGIHPFDISNIAIDQEIQEIEDLVLENKKAVKAIGECGLDYSSPPPGSRSRSRKDQISLFQKLIQLGYKHKLPLIIHNRLASEEIIKRVTHSFGVFHCFSGNKLVLEFGLKHDFYFGITGNITYNKKLQGIVKDIPLSKLLIETDSPYLMPEPLRSEKRWPNTPKNVKIVGQKIAYIKGDSFLKVAKATSDNAKKLFGLND